MRFSNVQTKPLDCNFGLQFPDRPHPPCPNGVHDDPSIEPVINNQAVDSTALSRSPHCDRREKQARYLPGAGTSAFDPSVQVFTELPKVEAGQG